MSHFVSRRTFRIEWGHCDPAGIVYYPRYLEMFHVSNALLFRQTGLTFTEITRKYGILGMPMVDIKVHFSLPCWFDEEVTVETQVEHWGRTSFTVLHRMLKKEGLAVECHEKRAWVIRHPEDPLRMKAVPVPKELIACLSDPSGKTRCV